jgi:hypothetical protein
MTLYINLLDFLFQDLFAKNLFTQLLENIIMSNYLCNIVLFISLRDLKTTTSGIILMDKAR